MGGADHGCESRACGICGEGARFQCLVCLREGRGWAPSFCTPDCYREHFKEHKAGRASTMATPNVSPRIKAAWPPGHQVERSHALQLHSPGATSTPPPKRQQQASWWGGRSHACSRAQPTSVVLPASSSSLHTWTMPSRAWCTSSLQTQALRLQCLPVYWLMYP